MISLTTLGEKFAAAIAALTLSVVMLNGTVQVPAEAQAQYGHAYVSVVA